MPERTWKDYVRDLSPADKERMLIAVLDYEMDFGVDGPIRFWQTNEVDDTKEHLYWDTCGENLLGGDDA